MKMKYYFLTTLISFMSLGSFAMAQDAAAKEQSIEQEKKYSQQEDNNMSHDIAGEPDDEGMPGRQWGRRGGGPGGPAGRGEGRRGFGRGMFGPPLSTEELMEFLKEHDKEKASQLKNMYETQPEQFEKFIGITCELYTPAARMMDYNAEVGKLMVANISLSLDVKKVVFDYYVAQDQKDKDKARALLKDKLSHQFDIIIKLQENEISSWQERISQFRDRMENGDTGEDESGRARGRGRGAGGFGPGMDMPGMQDKFEHMKKRMTTEVQKRKKDIVKWKEQKVQIVERQVADLLEDVRPFPWNN